MSEFSDPTPIATPEQFKRALLTVRDKSGISQKSWRCLKRTAALIVTLLPPANWRPRSDIPTTQRLIFTTANLPTS